MVDMTLPAPGSELLEDLGHHPGHGLEQVLFHAGGVSRQALLIVILQRGQRGIHRTNLGGLIGVRGTPAIILEDGEMLPGYVPANKLAKSLDAR